MRDGTGMEKDLVVTEKRLPTPISDYRPKDVAGMGDIMQDIINSAVPQLDCERMLKTVKCLQGALTCPGVGGRGGRCRSKT